MRRIFGITRLDRTADAIEHKHGRSVQGIWAEFGPPEHLRVVLLSWHWRATIAIGRFLESWARKHTHEIKVPLELD